MADKTTPAAQEAETASAVEVSPAIKTTSPSETTPATETAAPTASTDTAAPAVEEDAPAAKKVSHSGPYVPEGGTIRHVNGVTIITPPGLEAKREVAPQPQGVAPWEILGTDHLPPLFQGLAPQFPFDAAVYANQQERKRWRQAWYPYAQHLRSITQCMRTHLQKKPSSAANTEALDAYARLVQSISDDIDEVMRQNPDIREPWLIPNVRDGRPTVPRKTHSYLAYSQGILGEQQATLEKLLGDGENKEWRVNGVPVRRFGQTYTGDRFREVLHYRPQFEAPTGWTATFEDWSFWLRVAFWVFVAVMVTTLLADFLYSGRGMLLDALRKITFLPVEVIGYLWSKMLEVFDWIMNGGSAASFTPRTSSYGIPFITRSAYTTPTAHGIPLPTSTGSAFTSWEDSLPLEFKVSGTMKIFQAANL